MCCTVFYKTEQLAVEGETPVSLTFRPVKSTPTWRAWHGPGVGLIMIMMTRMILMTRMIMMTRMMILMIITMKTIMMMVMIKPAFL